VDGEPAVLPVSNQEIDVSFAVVPEGKIRTDPHLGKVDVIEYRGDELTCG